MPRPPRAAATASAGRSRPAERDDLDPPLDGDLGEGPVGDHQRGPRDREHPFARRLAVACITQGVAVAHNRHSTDPAQPARRPAVGPDRTEVGHVDDLATAPARQSGEPEVQGQERRGTGGCDRDPGALAGRDRAHPCRRGTRRGDDAGCIDNGLIRGRPEHLGHGRPGLDRREAGHRRNLPERAAVAVRQPFHSAPQLRRPRTRPGRARDLASFAQLFRRRRWRRLRNSNPRFESGGTILGPAHASLIGRRARATATSPRSPRREWPSASRWPRARGDRLPSYRRVM